VEKSENETSRARKLFEIEIQPVERVTAKNFMLPATVKRSLLLVTVRQSTRRRVIKLLQEGHGKNTE